MSKFKYIGQKKTAYSSDSLQTMQIQFVFSGGEWAVLALEFIFLNDC